MTLRPSALNCGLPLDVWHSHVGTQLRIDVWLKLFNLAPPTRQSSSASQANDTPPATVPASTRTRPAQQSKGKNKQPRLKKLPLKGGSRGRREESPDAMEVTPPTSPVNWNRFASLSPVVVRRRANSALLRMIKERKEAEKLQEELRFQRAQDPTIAPNGIRMRAERYCQPASAPTIALEDEWEIESLAG
ncbi:hypothetical protein QFC24_007080 [Naganishia onofrii]|uniref:Uncharacterized protein n=1 Tax=Naganishia onofrii TaxID=1851511 RepID=A0ACC2WV22_9TREE|nr:hypothetical protein QFC24_007080 [Naganishia onofrii]